MKSILILLALLSAAPHATVMAQIRRPVLPPFGPVIGPIPFSPDVPSIYRTNYPTAGSDYRTSYPTATGNPHTTANFSLSRTLSYATSRPSSTTIKTSTSTRTSTVTIFPLPTPIIPRPNPIIPRPQPFPCAVDTLFCNTLTTFSLCAPGLGRDPPQSIFLGDVAEGTLCRYGRIVRTPGGNCSPIGRLSCAEGGGRTFYLCAEGGEVDLGPVPRGTECIAGTIFAIRQSRVS